MDTHQDANPFSDDLMAQGITPISLGTTDLNGLSGHSFEQVERSRAVNEAGSAQEVSPQVDLMCAWDWSI